LIRTLRDKVIVYMVTQGPDTDRYGSLLDHVDAGTEYRANVQPVLETRGRDSAELEIDRDTFIDRFKVTLEPWATVNGLSRVQWEGDIFEVIGEPSLYKGRNSDHHLTFQIRRVKG
jgi:hypothetical protein